MLKHIGTVAEHVGFFSFLGVFIAVALAASVIAPMMRANEPLQRKRGS